MEDLHKIVMDLTNRVDRIEKTVERLDKRPDVLFKEEWMDGQDVQLALNISQRTLRTLRQGGKLTPARVNRKFYYKVADVKELLDSNYIRYHLKHLQ